MGSQPTRVNENPHIPAYGHAMACPYSGQLRIEPNAQKAQKGCLFLQNSCHLGAIVGVRSHELRRSPRLFS